MKKIFLLAIVLFLVACQSKVDAKKTLINYLNLYTTLDKSIKDEIDDVINQNDAFNKKHKQVYKDILYRQYKDMKFDILKEEYTQDKALITVNVNVYDLLKAEDDSLVYLSDHMSEFYDENQVFSNEKYISYKLDLMSKTEYRIDYEIIFYLTYEKGTWKVEQPTDSDLEKIHGIFQNNS